MVKIGVIPDLHLMSNNKDEVLEELEILKERFRSFQPDIIILLGDIIQDESYEEDKKHIIEAVSIMEEFESEVRFLGGNHDSVNLDLSELRTEFKNELWGMENIKGENLIFLDTSLPKGVPQGKVTEEQLEFLKKKLEEVDDAIMFLHHPIHYHDTQGTYWWHNRPEEAFCMNKKKVNEILSENPKVKAVFNGHVHYNKHVRYQGLDHLNLNAFNKEISNSHATASHAEITITEHKITTIVKERNKTVIGHIFPNKTQEKKLRQWESVDRELRRIK